MITLDSHCNLCPSVGLSELVFSAAASHGGSWSLRRRVHPSKLGHAVSLLLLRGDIELNLWLFSANECSVYSKAVRDEHGLL